MKKLFLMSLLILSLSACATTGTITSPTTAPSAVVSAQDAASKSLYAIGTALQATPQVLDALYAAGKMSKADYNAAVPIYNRSLGSYNLAVTALQASMVAGQDPSSAATYTSAMQTFLSDKTLIDNMLLAYGAQPIGAGVVQ
jgi:hypothetical protein